MEDDIATLIGLLDDESVDTAEGAKADLMSLGAEVVAPLMAAVTSLDRYGQLSAIEIFEHCGDVRAGRVLIDLLGSHHDTVRDWSAQALGVLGIGEAVPALVAAYERLKVRDVSPDEGECVSLRCALTVLGGRREVVPPLTASLRRSVGGLSAAWPSGRLTDVINELADFEQAVLYFSLWIVNDEGRAHGTEHETAPWRFDRGAPWEQAVEVARESALLEAAMIPNRNDMVATIEWIDRSDV